MDDEMTELVEFWLARLQEKAARATDPADWAFVLREIDADRRLLRQYEEAVAYYRRHRDAPAGELSGLEYAIRCRVAVRADHPDYREEWEPADGDLVATATATPAV
jgi:Family of unknown function (DUF6221)